MSEQDELEEIWQLFGVEGEDALNNAEECMLSLEQNAEDQEQIATLFRSMHTFKGMAGMMGMANIESIAHRGEDLVGMVRDEGAEYCQAIAQVLITTLDQMRNNFEHAVAHRCDVAVEENALVLQQLNKVIALKKGEEPAEPEVAVDTDNSEHITEQADEELKQAVTDDIKEDVKEEIPAIELEEPPAVNIELEESPSATETKQEETVSDPFSGEAFIRVFLEVADNSMAKLREQLSALVDKEDGAKEKVLDVLDDFHHASSSMKYDGVVAFIDKLSETVKNTDVNSEEGLHELTRLELGLNEEVEIIRHMINDNAATEEEKNHTHQKADIHSIFSQSVTTKLRQNITKLGELLDNVNNNYEDLLRISQTSTKKDELMLPILSVLRLLYQSYIFYDLHLPAQVTLVLQDLYSRIEQSELLISADLIQVTRKYIETTDNIIDYLENDKTLDNDKLEELNQEVKNLILNYDENEESRITKQVIQLLDMPDKMRELLTDENIGAIGQALNDDCFFYLLEIDLESDEEFAMQFYEWTTDSSVELITNVSVMDGEKIKFQFLVSTTFVEEEFIAQIKSFDPELTYTEYLCCDLVGDMDDGDILDLDDLGDFQIDDIVDINSDNDEHFASDKSPVNFDVMDIVGELVTNHSALMHIIQKLDNNQLITDFQKILGQYNIDEKRMENSVISLLEEWTEQFRNELHQTTHDFVTTVEHLRESALQMRERDISPQVKQFKQYVKELADNLNKKVKLDLSIDDIHIDYKLADTLFQSMCELINFILHQTPGTDDANQAINIGLKISKNEELIEAEITDNSQALDQVNKQFLYDQKMDAFDDVSSIKAQVYEKLGSAFDVLEENSGKFYYHYHADKNYYRIELPVASMVIDGMVVSNEKVSYIVPIKSIQRIVKLDRDSITHFSSDGGNQVIKIQEKLVPIVSLNKQHRFKRDEENIFLVVEEEHRTVAFAVDKLIGQQQVLIRPLDGLLSRIKNMSGCALLGGGEVGMVVDIGAVMRDVLHTGTE